MPTIGSEPPVARWRSQRMPHGMLNILSELWAVDSHTGKVLVIYVGGTLGMAPSTPSNTTPIPTAVPLMSSPALPTAAASSSSSAAPSSSTTDAMGLEGQTAAAATPADVVDDKVKKKHLAPQRHYLTHEMSILPELHSREMPAFDVLEYDELLDSSDMGIREWVRIARDVAHFYDQYDGFLIAHGTDTMHFTASALSFALDGLSKPVVLTGSMIPLYEPFTDTRRNLAVALRFAAARFLPGGVYLCFNDALMLGTRVVKRSDSVNAFASPNYPAVTIPETRVEEPSQPKYFARRAPPPLMRPADHQLTPTAAAAVAGGAYIAGTPGGAAGATAAPLIANSGDLAAAERRVLLESIDAHFRHDALQRAALHTVPPLELHTHFTDAVVCIAVTGYTDFAALRQWLELTDLEDEDEADADWEGRHEDERASMMAGQASVAANVRRKFETRVQPISGHQLSRRIEINSTARPRAVILRIPELSLLSPSSNPDGSGDPLVSSLVRQLASLGRVAARNGCMVCACAATDTPGLSLETEAVLRRYAPDVTPLTDMLAEVAVVKAMWVCAKAPGERMATRDVLRFERRLMRANLKGEITLRDRTGSTGVHSSGVVHQSNL